MTTEGHYRKRRSAESGKKYAPKKSRDCSRPFGQMCRKGRQIDWVIQSDRRCLGMAPTCIAVGSPFLNMISVGIERTP